MPLALSIGLMPCLIAIVLLVFGLSIGAYGFGVLLTLFLSLGGMLALFLVALGGMVIRSGTVAIFGMAARATVTRILELGGSVVIVAFGLVLFVSVV